MLSVILFITSIVFSHGTYISKPLWKHNDPNCKGSKLFPGQYLLPGEFLLSDNCIFELILQTDGNLVIYKNVVGFARVKWSSGTSNAAFLKYQSDGNVCIYWNNKAQWCSGNWKSDNYPTELKMQDDGNLVAYREHSDADWHSGTYEDELPEDANACFSCSNVEITDWQIVKVHTQPGTRKTNQKTYTLSQCNLPANAVQQSVTRSTTTDVTQSYTFSKSMSSTFSTSLTSSVSVSASAGVSVPGIGDASVETTTSIETSQSFSTTRSSTSTESMTTRVQNRLDKSYSFPLFYPAGKRTTHYLYDKSYDGIVEWKAVGTCYSDDRQVLESQPIYGTYHDVQFNEVVNDHDQCDCVTGHCTGMSYPGNTPTPDSEDDNGGGSSTNDNGGGSSTNRCGTDWANANSSCDNTSCPDGTDSLCPSGQKCYGQLATCEEQTAPSTMRCGSSWGAANGDCGATACPSGTNQECASGQMCYADLKECAARSTTTANVAFGTSGSLVTVLVCGGVAVVALVLVACCMRTKEYDDIPSEEDPLTSGHYRVVA